MNYESIMLKEVKRGDKVRPLGWPRARIVKQIRLNTETGSIWLWFPGNTVHWGDPVSHVDRVAT